MLVSLNVLGLSGAVLGGYFKTTNRLQHRAKQHSVARLGFLSVDSRACHALYFDRRAWVFCSTSFIFTEAVG